MVLVDTPIWIDHLHAGSSELAALLRAEMALIHPFIIGEIALGSLRNRRVVIERLMALDQAPMADHEEVMHLVEQNGLGGAGIGYVDAHLLAATKIMSGSRLWTRDKRLSAVAARLRIGYSNLN